MSQNGKYWQGPHNKSLDKRSANVAGSDDDVDEELDDDFSGSDEDYSVHDNNFDDSLAISSSFKQAPGAERTLSTSKNATATKETALAARIQLQRIEEEEKKQEREAKLKQIMRQQKSELQDKLGGSGDGQDDEDSDFSDSEDEVKPNGGAKSKKQAPKSAMEYYMKKAGKQEVSESSDVSEDDSDGTPAQTSIGAGLVSAKSKTVVKKKSSTDQAYEDDDDEFPSSGDDAPPTQKAKVGSFSKPTAAAAREHLDRIREEEKKQERDAKLQEIMRKQKAEMKSKLADGEQDDDSEDDEFPDSESPKASKQKVQAKSQGTKADTKKKEGGAMDYYMQKAGKKVTESSEISDIEESDEIPAAEKALAVDKTTKTQKSSKPTASAAREHLDRIREEEKKQERDAKLQEIMRQQKAEMKSKLADGEQEDDSEDDEFPDSEEDTPKASKQKVQAKSQGTKADTKMKQGGAMDYYMQKAGKKVTESSEISDIEESNEIPAAELARAAKKSPNSQKSEKISVKAAKQGKIQDSDENEIEDDEFQESLEKPTESMNIEQQFIQPKPKPIQPKKIPEEKQDDDLVEESIADDFVEESIEEQSFSVHDANEETIKSSGGNKDVKGIKSQETFSVHDVDEEEKDQVLDMQSQRQQMPGNSTVNMASVVPNARVVPPADFQQSFSPKNNQTMNHEQTASPMYVKNIPDNVSPKQKTSGSGDLMSNDEVREKPKRFVKHIGQANQSPARIIRKATSPSKSPSPNARQKADEDEINEQLKQIQPRYPQTKVPIVAKKAVRPNTALPQSTSNQTRVSANNRDLGRVSFQDQTTTSSNNNRYDKNNSSSVIKPMQMSQPSSSTQGTKKRSLSRPVSALPKSNKSSSKNSSVIQQCEPKKKENYQEISRAQVQEEKKFFKYEPKKSRLAASSASSGKNNSSKPQRRNREPEVVADEAENSQSQSPPPASLSVSNKRGTSGANVTGSASQQEGKKKKENYAEMSWAQAPEEKKFHKYEPKKRLPLSVVPPKKPAGQNKEQDVRTLNKGESFGELVLDEGTQNAPPMPRMPRGDNRDIAAQITRPTSAGTGAVSQPGAVGAGLAASLPGFSMPGLGGMAGFDIVQNIQDTIKQAAGTVVKKAKPGSAFGARNVPTMKKYELPTKFKPKIKEETKAALKEKSRITGVKKEEEFKKEKNPSIPSHKVVKKPQPVPVEGQENTEGNKQQKPPNANKPSNVVVHGGNGNKGSLHSFDPLAAMGAKSGKLQELKKLKQQQTKDNLVKQLEKSGILPSGPSSNSNRPQSGVSKKKKSGGLASKPAGRQQYKMPNKNRAFDNNNDLGDMFDDGELMAGDQGAAPMGGDDLDFGAGDLLKGDQAGNMLEDEDDVEFIEEDDDDEDAKWLEQEPTKKPKQPAALAKQKSTVSKQSKQSAQRETSWAGNGLGSGQLQVQKKAEEKKQAPKGTSIALEKPKPVKPVKPQGPLPWGFNPMQKTKAEVNLEEQKEKQDLAKEKFKELQHAKKEKAKGGNPQLNTFMAQMNSMDKKSKKDAKAENINPLIKNGQVKEVNPLSLIKSGVDRVPAEAGNVNDNESNSKMVQDLQKQLKQLFFENKQTNKQVQQIEKRKIVVGSQLDNIIAQKNIVKVNGQLQAKTEIQSAIKRILKSSDIPDYDKIAERVNPLEPVVQKFAEKGFTPLSVFSMLDIEDEDDILTFSEIKTGLKRLKIKLLDTEWQSLMKAIDIDGDGCVTIEEWQEILAPKLNAEREFMKIMKGLNIKDPLLLEEQILDTLYKKRRLAGEVKVMRNAKNQELFFRKKQVVQEQKAMADKIKQLQDKVSNQREREEEDRPSFGEQMQQDSLKTKADVEAEYDMLMKTKKDIEIDVGMIKEEHRKKLLQQDQLHGEVNKQGVSIKQDRDRKKLELKKKTIKLKMQREAEKKLDKELEAILGRAVTMADLEALYQQDLKLLGALEAGIGNKIGSMREIIMARYVQKAWRGYVARKRTKILRAKRKEFMEKYGVFTKQSLEGRRQRAVALIAKKWRAYALKKNQKQTDDEEKKEKEYAAHRKLRDKLTEEEMRILEWAANILQANWRAYKVRKELNKTKSGHSSMRFIKTYDPFAALQRDQNKTKKKSAALGDYNYHQQRICIQCDEEIATRQCLVCEDSIFCTSCFTSSHMIGPKKRHFFFKITYDAMKPEGASTWAAPAMPQISERSSSFVLNSEEDSSDSDSSIERDPGYHANVALDNYRQRIRMELVQGPLKVVPILNQNYTVNLFGSKGRSLF